MILFIKKIIKNCLKLICIPFVIIILILNLFIQLKFIRFNPSRIGHLSFDSEFYLRKKKYDNLILFASYSNKNICNVFMDKMIKRQFIFSNLFNLLHAANKLISDNNSIFVETAHHTNPDYTFAPSRNLINGPTQLKFTDNESQEGINFLNKVNPKKKKLITIIVRDSAYLPNLDYHNYRDCDINNMIKPIEYLIEKDFFVIRMGKIVHNHITINSEYFLDYPFSDYRSDFLDIWLMGNSFLTISTGTGLENISDIFNKNYLHLNMTPFMNYNSWSKKYLFAPKLFLNSNSKEKINFSKLIEIGAINFSSAQQYIEKDIVMCEIDPNNMIKIIDEKIKRIENQWEDTNEIKNIRENIRKKLINSESYYLYHIKENDYFLNLSSSYIEQNKEWLSN